MFIDRINSIVKYLIFILVAFVIYYTVPKTDHSDFDFKLNEIWNNNDLYAPVSFPILKSDEEIQREKNEIIKNTKPVFRLNTEVYPEILKILNFPEATTSNNKEQNDYILYNIEKQLENMYSAGVYNSRELDTIYTSGLISVIMPDNSLREMALSELYSLNSVKNKIAELLDSTESLILRKNEILRNLRANLQFDQVLTEQLLSSKFEEILPYTGIVHKGDLIIERGSIINAEKYQVLMSYKQKYLGNTTQGKINYFNHGGYLIIILLLFTVFIIYIYQFYKQIYSKNSDLLLILSLILVFILISAYLVKNTSFSIYLIPFCIVPLIIISFFEARIAFFSHILVIATVSLFIENAHEFFLIQIIAGLTVVILISRIRYISQFFIAVLILSGVNMLTYLGMNLLKVSSFSELDWKMAFWFGGNFILTLLAYPMIYAFEKLFSKVSDLTLIELSDVNKKLLKELATRAPGTFQHSLMLATLTESVLTKIGGNSLLAKVGCLYHDIGKLYAPLYFIENQKDNNPLDKIQNEKECASAIIRHVTEGVKIAREYNLPREVIHFIKTHHGTTRVEFFYRNYIKKNPQDVNCEDQFRYPGPKPTSKEMAVVMIADSIEAATRSLKEQTPEAIDQLVDTLVEQKMKDNQFQNANITLKEIKIAKDIIKNNLRSIYHQRIEYPSEN